MNETIAVVLARKDWTSWLFRINGRPANKSDEGFEKLGRAVCDAVPAEPGEYEVIVRRVEQ